MRDFANLHVEVGLLRVLVKAGLALLYAAFLAFLAPFGTYRFSTVERVGYWTVQMSAWLVLSLFFSWVLTRATYPGDQRKRILVIFVATLPMMLITGIANNMMNGWQPDAGELAELFVSIALIGGSHAFLSDQIVSNLMQAQPSYMPGEDQADIPDQAVDLVVAPAPSAESTLVEKLPPHIRGKITSLQVEDHYVRVHSLSGSAMVLMRFSDALRAVAHVEGAQVHRSWWVATDAVTGFRKTGRTAQLTLSDGSEVPVSQPYLAQAQKAWGAMAGRPI
jgi:hypothetical protein